MSFSEQIKKVIQTRTEGIEENDIIYHRHPKNSLQARIYRNNSKRKQPVIIDIHGGAWSSYDRTIGALYDRYIAAAGFTVIAIDFRQGPDYKHPSASEDIEAAIEYTLANADELGGNPIQIGLIGSSSGGHLALLTGITTKQRIDYIVALWPVSDPAYRYAYAKRVNRTGLVEAHEGYFTCIDNMHAASIQKILEEGKWNQLPPLLVVQPGEDANVPLEMTEELLHQYQSADGYLEYAFFPGEEHAFAHLPSPATDRCNALVVDFIKRHSDTKKLHTPHKP
jgi:acetyl esterase/lipase